MKYTSRIAGRPNCRWFSSSAIASASAHVDHVVGRRSLPGLDAGQGIEKMFGADRFGIPDGRQVEFVIPFEQLLFIGMKSARLPPGDIDVEQPRRVLDEFFHDGKL